ncbi:hypothetical protein ES705_03032 [subsurface metagenome]
MKKLLLILMVVALASFLFVGCIPGVVVDEDEDEDEVESACPTVSITSEVEIGGKKYIKGATQTVTVTYLVATDEISVWVGPAIKDNPVGVPSDAVEMVVYPDADNKVWTGTYHFDGTNEAGDDCMTDYLYITTCGSCVPCKFPYVVDDLNPCSEIDISEYPTTGCAACGGVNINFATEAATCDTCCGDECTSLDTATFDLYKTDPFDECCAVPCVPAIETCISTDCDIDCTISCFSIYDHYIYYPSASDGTATFANDHEAKTFYLVATLADKVGNKTYYYATVAITSGSVGAVYEYQKISAGNCTDWVTGEQLRTDGVIGACADAYGVCGSVY